MEFPAALVGPVDGFIEFVYSFGPLAEKTLILGGTLYLAPFFALGVFLNRFEGEATRGVKTAFLSSLAVLGTIHVWSVFAEPTMQIERRTFLALGLGLTASGSLILFRDALSLAPLARIGRYSFAIYLYHMFPVMALLAVYKMIGFPNPYLGVILGGASGLALPILAQFIALRFTPGHPWIPALTLGMSVPAKKNAGTKPHRRLSKSLTRP